MDKRHTYDLLSCAKTGMEKKNWMILTIVDMLRVSRKRKCHCYEADESLYFLPVQRNLDET